MELHGREPQRSRRVLLISMSLTTLLIKKILQRLKLIQNSIWRNRHRIQTREKSRNCKTWKSNSDSNLKGSKRRSEISFSRWNKITMLNWKISIASLNEKLINYQTSLEIPPYTLCNIHQSLIISNKLKISSVTSSSQSSISLTCRGARDRYTPLLRKNYASRLLLCFHYLLSCNLAAGLLNSSSKL